MSLNKIEYDAYAGFNAAKAYANFGEFFIGYLNDHPNWKPTKANLKSDEFELAFQIFARNGNQSSALIEAILENKDSKKEFKNHHQAFQVFTNASELYKVIKCDKHGHWVKNVDHVWYKNKILTNLTKSIDTETQKVLAKVYEKDLQSYINDYLTSNNNCVCKAFDDILWWLTNLHENKRSDNFKDLRRIFYAFQHHGHVHTPSGKVGFETLYNRPNKAELSKIGNSEQYKEFTKLLQSLNLCRTFGAKAHEFLYENLSYNKATKQYEVVPPAAPEKFPFTEQEVDKYLAQIREIKSKLPKKEQNDFASSDAIMLQTNDQRLSGMNTSTFGEYLVMLKIAYQYNISPKKVWEACVQNYNNPYPGNQWIATPNGDLIKFNTKLDSQLNGMYTATGGHADIEILSKSKGQKNAYNYSIFEPTVYDNETQTYRQEQDGILHILANELLENKQLKINKTSFNLVSFFDSKSLLDNFTDIAVGKYFRTQSPLSLKIKCYKYSSLPSEFKNLPAKLRNEKYYDGSLSLVSISAALAKAAKKTNR